MTSRSTCSIFLLSNALENMLPLQNHCSHDSCLSTLQLANSESQRMDAQDQLQIFEAKVKSSVDFSSKKSDQETSDLTHTINAKDQLIVKLEKDLKVSQTEATQMVSKRGIKHSLRTFIDSSLLWCQQVDILSAMT